MKIKIVKPYQFILGEWELKLPEGAKPLAVGQIGSIGHIFILEEAGAAPVITRKFLTTPNMRPTEMPDWAEYIGTVILFDPTGQANIVIPLHTFEITPKIFGATVH